MSNPSFAKLIRRPVKMVSSIDTELMSINRIGLSAKREALKSALSQTRPLRIAITPAQTASIALFTYLRDYGKLNVELVYNFPLSTSIVDTISKKNLESAVDGCVLTIASAGKLLGRQGEASYVPLMMMPCISHGVVVPYMHKRKYVKFRGNRILMVTDEPCTPSFVYDDLLRSQLMSGDMIRECLEPYEITEAMLGGDEGLLTILGFPHYRFMQLFTDCQLLAYHEQQRALTKEAVLFVSPDFLSHKHEGANLDIEIRNAWLILLENPQILSAVVDSMLRDYEYTKNLERTCGLFQLDWASSQLEEKIAGKNNI